jgi:thioredoxin-like negative regulator of GroEL
MKKILILVSVLLLTACQADNKVRFAEAYNLPDAEHVFTLVTMREMEQIAQERDITFVYFGSPICGACMTMTPRIDAHAKAAGINEVLYVELRFDSPLAAEWARNGTYDYRGTPLVVTFERGEFVRSNFTRVDVSGNYELEIVQMFEEFGARSLT